MNTTAGCPLPTTSVSLSPLWLLPVLQGPEKVTGRSVKMMGHDLDAIGLVQLH